MVYALGKKDSSLSFRPIQNPKLGTVFMAVVLHFGASGKNGISTLRLALEGAASREIVQARDKHRIFFTAVA
jgi:hypothetical protein